MHRRDGSIAKDGELLNLSYEVHLDHEQHNWDSAGGEDSRPSVQKDALFLVTKALFIYSPNLKNATIDFDLPKNWKVSSSWPRIEGKPNRYFADSWISLVNNALVVGSHKLSESFGIALGVGTEWETTNSFAVARFGAEYGIEIPVKEMEVIFAFNYDVIFNAYDSFNLGFGITKKF